MQTLSGPVRVGGLHKATKAFGRSRTCTAPRQAATQRLHSCRATSAAGQASMTAAVPVGLLASLAQLQAPLAARADEAAAPAAEAAAAASDAVAAAGNAAAQAGEAAAQTLELGPAGYALLLSPIVLYALFNVYRERLNPKATFQDFIFLAAAFAVIANLGSIIFAKVRLF